MLFLTHLLGSPSLILKRGITTPQFPFSNVREGVRG